MVKTGAEGESRGRGGGGFLGEGDEPRRRRRRKTARGTAVGSCIPGYQRADTDSGGRTSLTAWDSTCKADQPTDRRTETGMERAADRGRTSGQVETERCQRSIIDNTEQRPAVRRTNREIFLENRLRTEELHGRKDRRAWDVDIELCVVGV